MTMTPFTGRSTELGELGNILGRVKDGFVQVVFLTGESGVGKSHLAEEFMSHAASTGSQVWIGRAQSIGVGLAFAPIIAAFRMGLQGLPMSERLQIALDYPYINALLPELAKPSPQAVMTPELERTALFEGLRLLVSHLSKKQPLILFIDDLPEADQDTLEWIQYMISHTTDGQIMVLATCRTPLESTAKGFRHLQNALVRHASLTLMDIGPLSEVDVKELTRRILHGDVQAETVQAVQEHTLGIPFFVVELLNTLRQQHGLLNQDGVWSFQMGALNNVPRSIELIIEDRMNRLTTREQTLCNILAVSDGSVPWSVLQKMTQLDTSGLAESVVELSRIGLIYESGSDREVEYRFRHPMIKQAVYARISETVLRRTHQLLAEAWSTDPMRAAYHVRSAGTMVEVKQAVQMLYEAGLRSLSLRTYATATEYLELAMQIIEQQTDVFFMDETRRNTRLALGEAWMKVNRSEEALKVFTQLFREPIANTSKIRIKRLMAAIESARSYDVSLRHLQEGLHLWDGQAENEDILWMLDEWVNNRLNERDMASASVALEKLKHYVSLFPTGRNQLKAMIREAYANLLNWNRSLGYVEDAESLLASARMHGDLEMIGDAYGLLGYLEINLGDHEAAIRYCAEGTTEVRLYDMAIPEIFLRLMGLCGLFMAGKWDLFHKESSKLLRLSRKHGVNSAIASILDFQAMVYRMQDKHAKANIHLKELDHIRSSLLTKRHSDENAVIPAAKAVEIFQTNKFKNLDPIEIYWAPTHGMPLFMKLMENVFLVRSTKPEDALLFIRQLRSASSDHPMSYYAGLADFLDGRMAIRQGDFTSAVMLMEQAVRTFEMLNLPLETALARAEWVSACPVHSSVSVMNARKCRDEFRRLGMTTFAMWGERLLQRSLAETTKQVDMGKLDTLSKREQEIANFAARGLSNVQIAEYLGISARTVTKHVENIFRKLGVNSRTLLPQLLITSL